uniref:hypothetical protein n=1 Tax=Microbacterium proteolyticum TaxID=1572644 RepID=UPI00241634EC|nr:hypothetical protein [Microbacterium proteolyticum]
MTQIHPRVLATQVLGRDSYIMRSTLYYPAQKMYPIPPLRDCVIEDTCANCLDYRTWRNGYEVWAQEHSVEVLPEMVSPARIELDDLALVPRSTDPISSWLGFVGAMIELAR